MVQSDVIKAYKALDSIKDTPMPVKIAYQIYKLKKVLETRWEFQVEQETKLAEKFHAIPLEGYRVKFENGDDMDGWNEAIKKLNDMEVNDIFFEPVKIPNDVDIRVTPETMAALDGFVFMDI